MTNRVYYTHIYDLIYNEQLLVHNRRKRMSVKCFNHQGYSITYQGYVLHRKIHG